MFFSNQRKKGKESIHYNIHARITRPRIKRERNDNFSRKAQYIRFALLERFHFLPIMIS